jgi:hypothetical protein
MLLEDSELISIVPRPLANTLSTRYPLAMKELPYKTAPQRLDAVWHSNNDTDPGHIWLRARLGETVQTISANFDQDREGAKTVDSTNSSINP